MRKKIAGCLFLILLFGLYGCGVSPDSGQAAAHSESSAPSSMEADAAISDEQAEESLPDNEGAKMNPSFDFETRTVTLNSGYEMPIMGLGTYSLSDEECYNSVMALLEAGGRMIDTAYMYHNEESVGRAVRDSGIPREEIFVITKIYPSQFGNPEAAIEEAIEKMDIGYIDIMLLHHPGEGDVEAYLAMEKAVNEGKIHSIGLSKMEYGFNCVSCI